MASEIRVRATEESDRLRNVFRSESIAHAPPLAELDEHGKAPRGRSGIPHPEHCIEEIGCELLDET